MDKTMELVLVAMVLMVSAVIIIAMANSQIGGFGDTINDQREDVSGNLSEELGNIEGSDETSSENSEDFHPPGYSSVEDSGESLKV